MRNLRSLVATVVHAMGSQRRVFVVAAAAVLLLNVALPPVVLSAARKPWDHFAFNPWLRHLPRWLLSGEASAARKLEFVYNVAIYWFIADNPSADAPEWGYTATTRDVLRWLFLSVLFATYFALWAHRRNQVRTCPPGIVLRGGGRAGMAGLLLSTLGFSTLPCSVVGCGAPVLPVLGLALSGLELTSTTLGWITRGSRVITLLVYVLLLLGIVYLGRLVAADEWRGRPPAARLDLTVSPFEGDDGGGDPERSGG